MHKKTVHPIPPREAWTLARIRALAEHSWRHFREDRCFEQAAGLAYTSLLALVPLAAVAFGVVSAFPVFEQLRDQLLNFTFAYFVPQAAMQVRPYLENFINSANTLTIPGTVFLIVTALLLMHRIERALNRIWRTYSPRLLSHRLIMYWAVLTLGPLLLGVALTFSIQSAAQWLGWDDATPLWASQLTVFLFTWLAFSLVFFLVPNRKVDWRHALIGGALSAVLFEVAKFAFVAYVTRANFKVLYGTLATIPIFLLWVYIVWLVILLGASLAAALTTFSYRREAYDWSRSEQLFLLNRVLGQLSDAQNQGRALSGETIILAEGSAHDEVVQAMLQNLYAASWVTQNSAGEWLLCRDLNQLDLRDLLGAVDYPWPCVDDLSALPSNSQQQRDWDQALYDGLAQLCQTNQIVPIKSYYHQ